MTVIKLLALLVGLHVAFSVTQVSDYYFGEGQIGHGSSNLIAYTPLSYLLDDAERLQGDHLATDVGGREEAVGFFGILELLNRIGDSGFGLLTFDYAFLEKFAADTGITHNLDWIVKLIGVLLHFALGLSLVRLIFESGILTSTIGQVAVGLTGLAGAVSAITSRFL